MSNKLFCQALCGSCNSAVTRTSDIHGFQNLVSVQIGGSRTDPQPPHSTECTELFSGHPAAMRSVPDFAQFPPILHHFLPFEFIFLNQDNKTARLCKSLYEGSDLLSTFCDTRVSIYTRSDASTACKERLHLYSFSLNPRCGDPLLAERSEAALWHLHSPHLCARWGCGDDL